MKGINLAQVLSSRAYRAITYVPGACPAKGVVITVVIFTIFVISFFSGSSVWSSLVGTVWRGVRGSGYNTQGESRRNGIRMNCKQVEGPIEVLDGGEGLLNGSREIRRCKWDDKYRNWGLPLTTQYERGFRTRRGLFGLIITPTSYPIPRIGVLITQLGSRASYLGDVSRNSKLIKLLKKSSLPS